MSERRTNMQATRTLRQTQERGLEDYPFLTAGMEIKKSDFCEVSRGGFGAGFLTPFHGGPLERNNLRSVSNNQLRSSVSVGIVSV